MGDLVNLSAVRKAKSPNFQCECGGEWWVTCVKITKDLEQVNEWKIEGPPDLSPNPLDATPFCSRCERTLMEQILDEL